MGARCGDDPGFEVPDVPGVKVTLRHDLGLGVDDDAQVAQADEERDQEPQPGEEAPQRERPHIEVVALARLAVDQVPELRALPYEYLKFR